jgi:hypothetical protein
LLWRDKTDALSKQICINLKGSVSGGGGELFFDEITYDLVFFDYIWGEKICVYIF